MQKKLFLLLSACFILNNFSCKQRTIRSSVKNTGSLTKLSDFLAVAKILTKGEANCTGSVISRAPLRVLTAAHCIDTTNVAVALGQAGRFNFMDTDIVINEEKYRPLSIYLMKESHPKGFSKAGSEYFSKFFNARYDVAVYEFGENISLPKVVTINRDGNYNDNVLVIGFGTHFTGKIIKSEDGSDIPESTNGEFRSGTNTIDQRDKDFIYLSSKGIAVAGYAPPPNDKETVSLSGDSGGPLLDKNERVIGVLNGGYPPGQKSIEDPTQEDDFQGKFWSRYVDLSRKEIYTSIQPFLEKKFE